jgi:hypothetical protein
MNEQNLVEIEQKSYRELMQDGITETLLGLVLLVFPGIIHRSSLVPIFVVFYIIFMPYLIEGFRKRYVYPRIGYVKLKEEEPPKLSLGVAMVVLLIFVSVIVFLYSFSIGLIDMYFIWRWLPTVFGFITWGPSIYLKEKTGQNRFYLLGTLMTVTGIVISLSPSIPADIALITYMVSWGLFFLVLGLVRFLLFIRKYPVIDTPEDDSSEY